MDPPSLPYPKHKELHSGGLSDGRFRIVYHDISPTLVNYVSNITISKGHRLIAGFFGFGLLIAGFMDRILGFAVEDFTITAVFGLITSLILIFICFSRNVTISQLMKILEEHIREEGYEVLTHNPELKKELAKLEKGNYILDIPSPFLMLKGIELIPKQNVSKGKGGSEPS